MNYKLAGYPALLGSLSPSLRLPGFTRDTWIVIAQDNSFPDIFSKFDAEIVSPKTPPPRWVGMTGYKMNPFSRQFMKFLELLKCWPPKTSTPTPPGVVGVKFGIDFLCSSWHFPDFLIFDPLKFPLEYGGSNFFSWECVPYLSKYVCQI